MRELAKTDARYFDLNDDVKWSSARVQTYPGNQSFGYLSDQGLSNALGVNAVAGVGFRATGKVFSPAGWVGGYYLGLSKRHSR